MTDILCYVSSASITDFYPKWNKVKSERGDFLKKACVGAGRKKNSEKSNQSFVRYDKMVAE
ncbi:hypothetical protein J6TS7_51790 [Paenibacillus dendritiformis]|nr:hypothetical protein J6TS7_51790 [Paenibacillus dendritiformis]